MRPQGRVLYAEDDEAVGNAYATGLRLAGFDVHHVSDGAEALAALSTGGYDIFLLDLHMPVLNGFAVLEQLEASRGLRPLTPIVVILSADDSTVTMERAFELGAMAALPKSDYTPSRLARRITRWLEESPGLTA